MSDIESFDFKKTNEEEGNRFLKIPFRSESKSKENKSSTVLDILTEKLGQELINRPKEKNQEKSIDSSVSANTNDTPYVSYVEPLCDLFISIFDLKTKNNWLRKQAVKLVLQQIMNDTVEKKISEYLKWILSEEMIVFALQSLLDSFWPDGKWYGTWTARSKEKQEETRNEVQQKLDYILQGIKLYDEKIRWGPF